MVLWTSACWGSRMMLACLLKLPTSQPLQYSLSQNTIETAATVFQLFPLNADRLMSSLIFSPSGAIFFYAIIVLKLMLKCSFIS